MTNYAVQVTKFAIGQCSLRIDHFYNMHIVTTENNNDKNIIISLTSS